MEQNTPIPQPEDLQKSQLNSPKKRGSIVPVIILFLFLAGVALYVVKTRSLPTEPRFNGGNAIIPSLDQSFFSTDTLNKIKSESELIKLLQNGDSQSSRFSKDMMMIEERSSGVANRADAPQSDSAVRVSSTNSQTFGVDEPDIVKTDGSSIYYSREGQFRCFREPMFDLLPSAKIAPERCDSSPETLVVGALPPSEMKLKSTIPQQGEMLISGKTLVLFSNSDDGSLSVVGYSIANANTPKKIWEIPFHNRVQKVGVRLFNNKIYLVTNTSIALPKPCPIPLMDGERAVTIACTDIYVPSSKPTSNSVYSIISINPENGAVDKTVSMTGNNNYSSLYMSRNALYLSYMVEGDIIKVLNQFTQERKGVLPAYIEEKIQTLQSYDLSQQTKEMELQNVFSQYFNSLNEDERLTVENNFQNAFKSFFAKYNRSFEYTGIAKFTVDNLSFAGSGKVPGRILNQFSFDEWKGNLRVATTIGEQNRFYFSGFGDTQSESVSDVYVLDEKMKSIGSVKNLGKTERIYSVRFVGDRGYVVTFRQTDPFYVLDLSVPNSPQLKGELKIPGFSSYLHPIDEHLVLGIGRDNQVKLSLFDVKDAKNPKEISKYELAGEYWSEAMDNHHAFLQDAKYSIFFVPGGRGGYIFSYDGGELAMVKSIESAQVRRGLYLNDYLYIISDSGITTYREGTWDKVGEFFYSGKPINPIVPPILKEEQISVE